MYLVKQLLALVVLTSLAMLIKGIMAPLSISIVLWTLDILKTYYVAFWANLVEKYDLELSQHSFDHKYTCILFMKLRILIQL